MPKKYFILLLVFCVFITFNCDKKNPAKPTEEKILPDSDFWMMNIPLPQPMFTRTCEVNGKIYALGGTKDPDNEDPEDLIKTVYEFDPATKSWTTKGEKKIGRMGFEASAVNGKIYIFGGLFTCKGDALVHVEEYDPETGDCKIVGFMPSARACFATSVVNGKIYLIGGLRRCGESAYNSVDIFDPVTKEWTTAANMTFARYKLTTSVVNGKIYAIGGQSGRNQDDSEFHSTLEVYDPETDNWITLAPMDTARRDLRSEVIDGKIYVFGGRQYGEGLAITEMYDPETNEWDTKDEMEIGRYSHASGVINGKIFACGGAKDAPSGTNTTGPGIKEREDYTR